MPFRWNPREHLDLFRYVLKWLAISIPVGAAIGSAVALFLWSLDAVTKIRWAHPWLLFLLPIAGVAIPLTGAVLAIEVLAIGRLSYDAVIPCLMTSIIGDYPCSKWGILHTQYRVQSIALASNIGHTLQVSWAMGAKVAIAAVAF